ncbi:DUF4440 domain-containing protein [Cytobacillus sp. Hz8]|uniref:nuclear transport factor 2 family protein n=1 Tax=Cytobacillus sp. Hz8 TaxID=3347168 RepID=UPI0035E28322
MLDSTELKLQLLKLEQALLSPEIRTSPQKLEQFLADDFFEFGSSGTIWYKKDSVEGGGLTVRKMTLTDFSIYPLSEDVVFTTYRIQDETRNRETLRSSIWKWKDGRWQMFFHQGTITSS